MDLRAYNRDAWNNQVSRGCRWTIPVSAAETEKAKNGEWSVVLTPKLPVPKSWFGEIRGLKILGLASAGGQQGPILSAAGADVTIYDNSPAQLGRDQEVSLRDQLTIKTIEGDMADLGEIASESFDLVFHPCSNGYVENVNPVWREAFRVLRPGGHLLAGFSNPDSFIFDDLLMEEKGIMEVRYKIPFNEKTDLEKNRLKKLVTDGEPLLCSHTWTDQIGGQLRAGFHLVDMYEDSWSESPLADFMRLFVATRAQKPL